MTGRGALQDLGGELTNRTLSRAETQFFKTYSTINIEILETECTFQIKVITKSKFKVIMLKPTQLFMIKIVYLVFLNSTGS